LEYLPEGDTALPDSNIRWAPPLSLFRHDAATQDRADNHMTKEVSKVVIHPDRKTDAPRPYPDFHPHPSPRGSIALSRLEQNAPHPGDLPALRA